MITISPNSSAIPDSPGAWKSTLALLPGYDCFATAGPGEWFDLAAASKAIRFFHKCLKHIEGEAAGKPFILQPWQQAFIGCLFGWKRADGSRRYRECLLYIARGNGKSPLAAGIAIYLLYCDGEAGAQIYLVAKEAEQAALMFRTAAGMIRAEPELEQRSQIFKGTGHRSIVLKDDPAAVVRVVSSDSGSKHGYNPHAVIGDELHAWKGTELSDALETAFRKKGRRQPLLLWTTTADYDRESVCNSKYAYACRVRDNGGDATKPGFDSSFLPIIYESTGQDDWLDENKWELSNPNIDVTVDRERLRIAVQQAQEQPSKQNELKRLNFNIRTTNQHCYISTDRWDLCADDTPDAMLKGRDCYAALDVSSKQDVTALVLVFAPRLATDKYVVRPFFWIPEANMRKREKTDQVPYSAWIRAGHVFATDGDVIDEAAIQEFIVNLHEKRFKIRELGYDPWNAQGLGVRLQTYGMNVVEIPQTPGNLTPGTKALDDLVAGQRVQHGGNPVLRWMLTCTDIKATSTGGERPVKPTRQQTGKRIDGIVATIMALGLALRHAPTKKSIYETRGLTRITA